MGLLVEKEKASVQLVIHLIKAYPCLFVCVCVCCSVFMNN